MWTNSKLSLLGLLSLLVLLCSTRDVDPAGKRRRKANTDEKYFFSGTTPSGATVWKSDAKGVIYTDIDTSHLKFDRVPKYYCSVASDARKNLLPVNVTLTKMLEINPLVNLTGKTTPTKTSTSGFRVRLRYKPEVGKDLSESVARVGGWRVKWVALSEGHSLLNAARENVINEKYDDGIDEKPVGQSLSYVQMLESFAKEDLSMIHSILAVDYELPLSKRPKPAPKKETKPKAEKSETKEEPKTEGAEGGSSSSEQKEGEATEKAADSGENQAEA